jgi:tetratricopeptide (TPR) repeat protein
MASLTAGQRLFAELEIDLDTVPIEYLDDFVAIEYFLLLEDEPPAIANNLEKVDRYLQVFNHLSEATAWQQAGKVLSFRLETNGKELHDQLRIWGYYREQIELYQELLGKVSPEQDLVCFNGLGKAFYVLCDYSKALNYYQQQLDLARLVNIRQTEAQALYGLGVLQFRQFKHPEALSSHQQQLKIARDIGDQVQEGYAMQGLGATLFDLGSTKGKKQYQKSGLKHLEKALEIARELGDWELETESLNSIQGIYYNHGQLDKAVEYLIQELDICNKFGDQRGRYLALQNLSISYMMLKQHKKALECIKEALTIACEIGDRIAEGRTYNSIGFLYYHGFQQHQNSIPYFEKGLDIARKFDIKQDMVRCVINLSVCHVFLQQEVKAAFYLTMAESIVKEVDSFETKGMVTMAFANAYWNRDQIWFKLFGLFLAAKGLIMIPPWRNANGRIALQLTIAVLTKSAKNAAVSMIQGMKNLLIKHWFQRFWIQRNG